MSFFPPPSIATSVAASAILLEDELFLFLAYKVQKPLSKKTPDYDMSSVPVLCRKNKVTIVSLTLVSKYAFRYSFVGGDNISYPVRPDHPTPLIIDKPLSLSEKNIADFNLPNYVYDWITSVNQVVYIRSNGHIQFELNCDLATKVNLFVSNYTEINPAQKQSFDVITNFVNSSNPEAQDPAEQPHYPFWAAVLPTLALIYHYRFTNILSFLCNIAFCFEAVDRTFKDVLECNNLFGGIPIVLEGDIAQISPVVPKGSGSDIINASLINSWVHSTHT
ncbi:MAG: hypothetical protein EXX96DRAFT_653299 [Benjaminiella poitrasii]|nr:MAG: hypothetical protein EXX96DRAFT_653299 [Benjaminiella poitrasii]